MSEPCHAQTGHCIIALERADAAQRDINRVEGSLGDRFNDLNTAVTNGFEEINKKLDQMSAEIVALKVENASRGGALRLFKWLFTTAMAIALALAGIIFNGHSTPPPQH